MLKDLFLRVEKESLFDPLVLWWHACRTPTEIFQLLKQKKWQNYFFIRLGALV